MRLLRCAGALSILLLAGCPGGSLGGDGTGGAKGTGGVTGTGGAGGSGAASPGTVRLQLEVPTVRRYCDENPSCTSTQHLWLTTASGQALTLGSVGCGVDCETCSAPPCLETPLIACPAGSWGSAVATSSFIWDGSYTVNESCGPTGSSVAISCTAPKYAAPGTYVAHFCATPGTLDLSDGGAAVCTPTGSLECIDVPFVFPAPASAQEVVVALPAE
jgi:hypothetical protein